MKQRIVISPSPVALGNVNPYAPTGGKVVAVALGVAFSAGMGAIVAPWFKVQRKKGAKIGAASTAVASIAGMALGASGILK